MNIFVESGSDGAALLVESPDVPTISFSGETLTGRAFAGHPPRFGSLIWNDQTALAKATPADPAKTRRARADLFRGSLDKGAFFRPAMLEVTDNSLAIVQEETFGPVLTIQRFRR